MTEPRPDVRRALPQVERLAAELAGEAGSLPRPVVVEAVRTVVEAIRRTASATGRVPAADEVKAAAADELRRRRRALLKPVVNATGVVLHTNLGRAPLSEAAVAAVAEVAARYSNLELDLDSGRRGSRFAHVEPLIATATGAEAALVVNNNAAAVFLVCAALAAGRQVVVSRGELIEIGGSFRIPDVLAASGARLREVGTTNRTHARDYEGAIGDDTAMLLAVHPSNYRVVGFTTSPPLEELGRIAGAHGVPLIFDAGSGLVGRAMADEPAVERALAAGASLVCFSGDKLFGGPQAGVVCGRRVLVDRLRIHPLLRALRPDKMTIAALQATVAAYLDGTEAELPVWRMIEAPAAGLRRRADVMAERVSQLGYECHVADAESVPGGGSLPGHSLPTATIQIRHPGRPASALAGLLREGDPAVVARVEGGYVVCDLRTVFPDEDEQVVRALEAAV